MESLLLRLEAALGRLEASAPLRSADQRLETAVARLETLLGSSPAPPPSATTHCRPTRSSASPAPASRPQQR